MKRIFFAAALLAVVASCNPKHDGYTITGTITGAADGQIILHNTSKAEPIADTAEIKDGKFTFTGKVTTPEFYIISMGEKRMQLFVDNSEIKVAGVIDSLNKATVTGSQLGEEIQNMRNKKRQLVDALEAKYNFAALDKEHKDPATKPERKKEIEEMATKLRPEMEANEKAQTEIDSAFMAANPLSPYTVILVQRDAYDMNFTKLSAYVDGFVAAPSLAGNRMVKELQEAVATLGKIQVGQPAPDFTQNTPNGKSISLSEVYPKNKITMIDFWASWCPPCRRFNPTLVKIYEKYHKKGFEIFATSFDRPDGKEKWEKAIKDDKLPWIHVSDLQFWNNAAGQLYATRSIPANVFVGQDGKILARQLSEDQIEKFLDEHLK